MSDSESATQVVNGIADDENLDLLRDPSTPQDNDLLVATDSQESLPSTEVPPSPIDPSASFKTEANDDRLDSSAIIPSSLTPPPSSQIPSNGAGAGHASGYIGSQRSGFFSPPATVLNTLRQEDGSVSDYITPTPQEVVEASPEELRSMLQSCIAEHARLKMETAHHKLQYNLLSLQAEEDVKRALVEQEMTRREIEALRTADNTRLARLELDTASETLQAKYIDLKTWYDQAVDENETLHRRLKLAKKVIQQKEDENMTLADERDMLLNRIRENREHFHILCSPGGMFHGASTAAAATPKTQHQNTVSTPQQHRTTPRQTPKSASARRDTRDQDHRPENIAMLLQVLSQENNSAPSTPTSGHRPAPRASSKHHTRNAQSMSSLPTTPTSRRGVDTHSGLLPSVDLVPQSEPPYRHNTSSRYGAEPSRGRRSNVVVAGVSHERRRSRESTISAEDNEELARQALKSVAAAASFASMSASQHHSRGGRGDGEDEEVYESQASQAASEMLRRDPRESFDAASSVGGSRDATPSVPAAAAEKSAKLQARLLGGLHKSGTGAPPAGEKRKFSGGQGDEEASKQLHKDLLASPTKKLRTVGGLRDGGRVGLGIQYGCDA